MDVKFVDFGVSADNIEDQILEQRAPWTLRIKKQIRVDLAELKKEETQNCIYKQNYLN